MTRAAPLIPARSHPPGLFITGTSTGVGKTYVGTLIARSLVAAGFRVGVYKPVLSGFGTELAGAEDEALTSSGDDDVQLWLAAGRPGELTYVCPQRFRAPLAPPLAARQERREVNADLLRSGLKYWQQRSDVILVEGAGGLMSPVTDDEYVADLAEDFGYPLLIVARDELGVINQTLQTLITAATFRDGIPVAGIVLNEAASGTSSPDHRLELQKRAVAPVLATIGWQTPDETDWKSSLGL